MVVVVRRWGVLMQRTVSHLSDLTHQPEFRQVAQRPDVLRQVSCLLERVRGCARATKARSQRSGRAIGQALMAPLLLLLDAYAGEAGVVYLLLKFWVEWVEAHVAFLDREATRQLMDFCVRLLEMYSKNNCGRVGGGRENRGWG